MVLGLLVVLTIILRSFFIEVLWVQTSRFAPLLLPGDLVLSFRHSEPKRMDFVIHSCAARPFCLSQIVGLPGDRIDQKSGRLIVNDKPLGSNLLPRSDAVPLEFESLVVPPSQYFLLGDNSGVQDASHISSVFRRILFSINSEDPSVRWGRIGQTTR